MHARLVLPAALALCGCSALQPNVEFAAIEDLYTTNPVSLAEGGYGEQVVPPEGVAWSSDLVGYEENVLDTLPGRHYEMRLTLLERRTASGAWAALPVGTGCELADDQGGRFECSQLRAPVARDDVSAGTSKDPARLQYRLVFDLPTTYLFRPILTVTVHWVLELADGAKVRISTRFRR